MNTKEKAEWLSGFYAQVAKGGEIEYRPSIKEPWRDAIGGPGWENNLDKWRIKPK